MQNVYCTCHMASCTYSSSIFVMDIHVDITNVYRYAKKPLYACKNAHILNHLFLKLMKLSGIPGIWSSLPSLINTIQLRYIPGGGDGQKYTCM